MYVKETSHWHDQQQTESLCQSILHNSRQKLSKHTTQQQAESLRQSTLHNIRLKVCDRAHYTTAGWNSVEAHHTTADILPFYASTHKKKRIFQPTNSNFKRIVSDVSVLEILINIDKLRLQGHWDKDYWLFAICQNMHEKIAKIYIFIKNNVVLYIFNFTAIVHY